ncbi:putative epoxide hydrolase [Glarea lozoyensis 74030]|uniref:Putative epoxide hydrolase n=1 Tax=Glarea lozoyensis (strain ATCC 74030 / MF5533) TaxID=1104152 RepID=H0EX02_GLAL7|nr:putative epoxide hydrolase [Glarea lozoyensis 74030]
MSTTPLTTPPTPLPFQISIPPSTLSTFKSKLLAAEFPDELQSSQWDMGVPLAEMKRLTKAFAEWDWRQAERELNLVPQFVTPVEVEGFGGVDVHFVWERSEVEGAVPLLFVHGSPSLPNFGFSSGIKTRGFGIAQYAETCHKLMLSLGYPQYVTQGGDWGFYITRAIGHLYPDSCMASHINMLRAPPPKFKKNPILATQHKLTSYTKAEEEGFKRTEWFAQEGRGYYMEQATKPQTLAYALTDSPVALLAWIYEKMHDWTDEYPWSDEEVFRWVAIYAFSRAGPGAAHRIYYETMHTGEGGITRDIVEGWIPKVKLGLAYNPKEISVLPATWCRTLGPVVYEAFNESGGHFYATEKPALLARDLRTMFGKGGGAYKVVKGRTFSSPPSFQTFLLLTSI